jgi:hypothetical protein
MMQKRLKRENERIGTTMKLTAKKTVGRILYSCDICFNKFMSTVYHSLQTVLQYLYESFNLGIYFDTCN